MPQIPNLRTVTNGVDDVDAQDHNDVKTAIEIINEAVDVNSVGSIRQCVLASIMDANGKPAFLNAPVMIGDTWSEKLSVGLSDNKHAAVTVGSKIYLMGGMNTSSTAQNKNREYDPINNTWAIKANVPAVRAYPVAVAYNNFAYLIGGTSGSTASTAVATIYEYNATANTWSTSRTSMSVARYMHCGAVYEDKIYIFGGRNTSGTVLDSVVQYDITNNIWTDMTSMPAAKEGALAFTHNNKIYIVGGSTQDTYVYDITTNTWDSTKAIIPAQRNIPSGVIQDDKIYVFGGIQVSTANGCA